MKRMRWLAVAMVVAVAVLTLSGYSHMKPYKLAFETGGADTVFFVDSTAVDRDRDGVTDYYTYDHPAAVLVENPDEISCFMDVWFGKGTSLETGDYFESTLGGSGGLGRKIISTDRSYLILGPVHAIHFTNLGDTLYCTPLD